MANTTKYHVQFVSENLFLIHRCVLIHPTTSSRAFISHSVISALAIDITVTIDVAIIVNITIMVEINTSCIV